MKQAYYILTRDVPFNGNPIGIKIKIKKEEIQKNIITKKTYIDLEGNIWDIVGENEVEHLSRDGFG